MNKQVEYMDDIREIRNEDIRRNNEFMTTVSNILLNLASLTPEQRKYFEEVSQDGALEYSYKKTIHPQWEN